VSASSGRTLLEKDVREDLAGGQDRAGRHHVLLRRILPRGRLPECLDAVLRLVVGAQGECATMSACISTCSTQ
jgi:hypothetical protein